jgi:hypothetical protein
MYCTSLRLFTLAFASTLLALSAGDGASVAGKVLDPQGRSVSGTSISLFANNGDAELRTTADVSGSYRFEHLKAGDYLLEAHAAGFSTYRVDNVHVDADTQLTLDLPLAVGTVQEQVSVTASNTPQPVARSQRLL